MSGIRTEKMKRKKPEISLIFPFVILPRTSFPSPGEIYTFGEPQHYFMERIKIL